MNTWHKAINSSFFLGTLMAGLVTGIRPAIAQLLYPPVSDQQVISVTGQGSASVPADQAQIDMLLTNRNPNPPRPFPSELPLEEETVSEPQPITLVSLSGVIDALIAVGMSESDIRVNLSAVPVASFYVPGDSIILSIQQPTRSRINELVQVVDETLKEQSPQQTAFVNRVYVQYAVNSCDSLEQRAYAAAMDDAALRARAIADATNVSLAPPPSVAEFPFFGRFLSPCSEDTDTLGDLFRGPASNAYDPEAPAEVEVFRELLVTYPVE